MGDPVRIAAIRDRPSEPFGDAEPMIGLGEQHDPPSELIRPPSKAAVIFLRRTAGKQNGRRLSSIMAGRSRWR